MQPMASARLAEDRHGEVAQQRLHGGGEMEHPEADEEPPARVAADERVLLEGADQPVDDRAVDGQLRRQLGDGQSFGAAASTRSTRSPRSRVWEVSAVMWPI